MEYTAGGELFEYSISIPIWIIVANNNQKQSQKFFLCFLW